MMSFRAGWAAVVLLTAAAAGAADHWPAWRGAGADGQVREKNLPVRWSATENVRWKTPLPGPGNSTPAVWGDRIFLTQSIDAAGRQRAVMCLDRKDGKVLWQKSIPFEDKESTHQTNPYCSASPATDGERVVAWMGSAGLVCYDLRGNQLWFKDLGKFEHIWGNASSPVIYKDLVIQNCGPGERTFLAAFDKRTGREVWRVDEPGGKFGTTNAEWLGSWSTPVVATLRGREELVMSWPGALKAYDPATGKLLWTCRGLTPLVYTSPLISPDVIVAMSGFQGSWMAVRTGGNGDVTDTHRLWHVPRAQQRIGSGVIVGDHIYMVNEPGVAECIELRSGKVVWSERLGGSTWGSLLHSEGKLYVTGRRGETYIFAARPQFERIALNPLNETTLSSIAVSNGDLFIRTYQHLWCLRGAGS